MITVDQIPAHRQPKQVGNSIWIKCPWHKNGQESTPSLKINAVGENGYPPGSWTCFGCAPRKGGAWRILAKKLGIAKGGNTLEATPISDTSKFLGEDDNEDHEQLLNYPLVPESMTWRGISGKLLNRLEARYIGEYNTPRVYLPFVQNGEWLGGVQCSYDGSEPKYIYEKNIPIRQLLFPFDYVKRLKPRYVVLCEGPRDALNLLQYDIPALANLGGFTTWSEDKAEQVSFLNVKMVVLAFDPDKVGRRLTSVAKRDLSTYVSATPRFKMKSEIKEGKNIIREKEDPGNLSKKRISYLKAKIKERLEKL